MVVLGCLAQAFALQSVLGSVATSAPFFSESTWQRIVRNLGGEFLVNPTGRPELGDVPFFSLFSILMVVSSIALTGFASVVRLVRTKDVSSGTPTLMPSVLERTRWVAVSGWRWWLLPWLWEMVRVLIFACGFETITILMTVLFHYVIAISLAGLRAELLLPLFRPDVMTAVDRGVGDPGRPGKANAPAILWVGVVAYVVVFTTMNWQLYRGLLVPHGDSAMYEEHLWNVLHGKGFRSYLDQGLFLGEHIQVLHLAFLPFYVIWPSHLLLEFFESLALASGAFPVFWMARRWSGSSRSATCLAIAYLLYPPLQFLDIAIDLKTFRPICFGMTAMLFALDQLERGRIKSTVVLFVVALLAKEDFALILAPLGCWIAAQPFLKNVQSSAEPGGLLPEFLTSRKSAIKYGTGLAIASVGYLLLTTRVLIPWFRGGAEVHYARYFAKFGGSLSEIIVNMLTQPGLLIEELVTVASFGYLLALLLPLAFLPLLSGTRFCVAVPILGLLCLNEIVKGDPQPHHHFHAPVIPVLFWSAAHSLRMFCGQTQGRFRFLFSRFLSPNLNFVPMFVLVLCGSIGAVVGMSPLSIKFWDSGSFFYWQKLYVPTERATRFATVLEQIPPDARVASTDFVHPRFTHHERSYDYSDYLRRVAGGEDKVPDDTDFIVIDTRHYYSDVRSPDDVRELKTEPEKWEHLPDRTGGFFIILKRRE